VTVDAACRSTSIGFAVTLRTERSDTISREVGRCMSELNELTMKLMIDEKEGEKEKNSFFYYCPNSPSFSNLKYRNERIMERIGAVRVFVCRFRAALKRTEAAFAMACLQRVTS
jgi:hypothetical protein